MDTIDDDRLLLVNERQDHADPLKESIDHQLQVSGGLRDYNNYDNDDTTKMRPELADRRSDRDEWLIESGISWMNYTLAIRERLQRKISRKGERGRRQAGWRRAF